MTHLSNVRIGPTRARVILSLAITAAFLLVTAKSGLADGPGARSGPDRERASMINLGTSHSCVVFDSGATNCWGQSSWGQLGRGSTTQDIGDNETPASAGNLDLGTGVKAVAVASGSIHSCVLTATGAVKCWGNGGLGRLGYGNTTDIGDNETPAAVGTVDIGGTAAAVTAGGTYTCVLLTNGAVKCWGAGSGGRLGYGNTNNIGDDELPSSIGPVSLGGTAAAITAGNTHTCALLNDGTVKCWGAGTFGVLGYGNTTTIGDDELPSSIGPVSLGGTAAAITAGISHTCALLSDGTVKCWGAGASGQLGYGNTNNIGDDELPSSVGPVNLGGTAVAITAGNYHTCALLSDGTVRCWGSGANGRLGYGNTTTIGDNELPSSVGPVNLGGTAVAISAGQSTTCAVMTGGTVKCWGDGSSGQLGYGNTTTIGDDELPSAVGTVNLGGTVLPSTTTTTSTLAPATTVASTVAPAAAATTTTAPAVTTTMLAAAAPVTTVAAVAPTLRSGRSITAAATARLARLTVATGSKASVKVSRSSAAHCKLVGTSLRGLKAGTCRVTVTVTPKKGRAVSRTVSLKVT